MKRWFVTAKFPQALAKNTFQSVKVEAGSVHTALRIAARDLLGRPGIKGLRHKNIQFSISRDVDAVEFVREA
jgi:hypothetical protein